jgi:molecular chaperone DnaK (HSP70)
LLSKSNGTICTLGIHGDLFLGGYDFDKSLALWLLHRLNACGYDLDANNPMTFAQLMIYAERAKSELSRSERYLWQELGGITDRYGEQVDLDLEITRDDFEAMIGCVPPFTHTVAQPFEGLSLKNPQRLVRLSFPVDPI